MSSSPAADPTTGSSGAGSSEAGSSAVGSTGSVAGSAVASVGAAGAGSVEDVLLDRPVPAADPLADFFWRSGADGRLRLLRCQNCSFYIHPPSRPCPRCLSRDVAPEPVSGRAVVHTYTINVQPWTPGQPPYVIAVVDLPEQPELRLTTNVLGCPPDAVHIGQQLRVAFVPRHGRHYPVFVPA